MGKRQGTGRETRRVGHGLRARHGFTLVELAIAMSILMVGLVSTGAATMRMHHLRRQNRERMVAQNAVRSVSERIHAQSYRFSADPSTWSANLLAVFGPNGTFGTEFDVALLTPPNEGQEFPGSIQIITDETLTDDQLGHELGMPRDLNADGDASDTVVSQGARILPVIISVSWRSQSGVSRIDHGFYVMGY